MDTRTRTENLLTNVGIEGLLVQRVPMYCKNTKRVVYRLDVRKIGRNPTEVVDEWVALLEKLNRVHTVFLVSFDEGLEDLKRVKAKRNIKFVRAKDFLEGNLYRIGDKVFEQGWDALYRASAAAKTEKFSPTLPVLIRLMSCLRRDGDLGEVVAEIKADPVVQYNLVRYLNRAHLGFDYKFTNFDQAVMVLGYRTLERWLSTFLLWSNVKHYMPDLCRLALIRGRQMELLAQRQEMDEVTQGVAYITGVFSALPMIFGVPLETILGPFDSDDLVVTTLRERSGPLVQLLDYVRATEGGPARTLEKALKKIGITPREANHVLLESLLYGECHLIQ